MSGDPRQLKATLLEESSTEQQRQFAKMLAEECAKADLQVDHRCWCFIPTPTEYERMAKYAGDDKCPKCKKGRILLEIFHGNIGESYWLRCRWGEKDCGYEENIDDEDRW